MAAIQEPYTCTVEEFSSSDDALYPERISGDGTIAVTRHEGNQTDYEVQMYKWDIDSLAWTQHGEPIKDKTSDDPVWNIDLSSDGSVLALFADDTSYEINTRFFRFESGSWQQIGKSIEAWSENHPLSGDGHSVVAGGRGDVYELDSSDWHRKGQSVPSFGQGNRALSFNGSILASGAQVYQFANGWIPMGEPAISLANPNTNEVMQGVALSPDGRRLAVAMNRVNSVGPIYFFEFNGDSWAPLGQVLEPIWGRNDGFWGMHFSGTILAYHSVTWTWHNHCHYMRVFYLQGNAWVEIEGDRWNGHFVTPAAMTNESLVSFLSTTKEGVSTVYHVACRHTSETIPSQNDCLRFANIMVPLVILSILFRRMMKQTPKRHSDVELAELKATHLT